MKTGKKVFRAKETHVQWPIIKISRAILREHSTVQLALGKKVTRGVVGIAWTVHIHDGFEYRLR